MDSFEVNLSKAIAVCDGRVLIHDEPIFPSNFYKIYTFTTENVNDYMKYFDFEDKSLLTVGSSFDQCLNAFYYGARDITLYDINPYSKYYAYFKIAAIICLDYKEFQLFFLKRGLNQYDNEFMFSKDIFDKLKSTLRLLDYESFLFYDELFNLYYNYRIRDYLFNDDDEFENDVIRNYNIYLNNEENYNKLKSIIKKITFKFVNGDIFKDSITGKYDNILLSNLCCVTNINEFKTLLEKLDNNNLNINGSMLVSYLWRVNYDEKEYKDDWKDIYKMPITRDVLRDYITEYYDIIGSRDISWQEDNKEDLVLIYRKKK